MTRVRKTQVVRARDHTCKLGVRECYFQASITILCILFFALTSSTTAAQQGGRNVLLLLSSVQRDGRFSDVELLIRARVPGPITFHHSYLEASQTEQQSYLESQAETFRRTYAGIKLDLVIAGNPEQLKFAVQYRDKIFPGVPIVFIAVSSRELEGQRMWPGVTGVAVPVGLRETIDLAVHLHPDTETVAVIANASTSIARYWLAATHAELLRHQDRLKEIDLIGPPSTQLLNRVAALPPHTVALFNLAPDSSQPAFSALDLLTTVAQRLPTYSAWPSLCLNYGCVGGAYEDSQKEDSRLGEISARILLGERPEDIPVVHASDLQVRVDWRALRRWKIPESALPPGSVILYREPTLWERDRKYIIPTIVLITALLLLVAGLLWERAKKRKAEAVLRESEGRFRMMTDTTPALVWMCDAQGKITYLNERRIAFTGPEPDARFGDTWIAHVHSDDQMKVLDTLSRALTTRQPFSQEYRLRRSDGVYRWMFDVASPRVNGDGSFGGFIGSAIDITDQKLAHEALEKVSGQLIEAQEKERSRIARDLHDDICQRLALLSMELEVANRNANKSPAATKRSLEDIQKHCSEIAGDVQSLSHQLHSSRLDYLGIVAAIRGFCGELSKQHEVNVEFSAKDVPEYLPKDVSLCLFRVAQEAIHNSIKYSGVRQFTVELSRIEGGIGLVVSDAGAGFDVQAAKKKGGLGLLSMQERIRLVHGSFSVESNPWQGTRVVVSVPVLAKGPNTGSKEGDDPVPNMTRIQ
jgi:PAS domain S-box-containing protein